MDLPNFLSQSFDWLASLAGTLSATVATTIFGGWFAVGGFAAAILLLFLVTSILSPAGTDGDD